MLGRGAQRLGRGADRLNAAAHNPVVLKIMRLLGLARRGIPVPVVGKRAYVRWWERVLAAIALVIVVLLVSIVMVVLVGLLVLAAGVLLEQAIA